jgi:hypothetical protein
MAARRHLPRSVIAATAALAIAGCGSGKEPPPLKEVAQPTTTSEATAAPTGTTSVTITNLPARDQRALGPLVDARDALAARAQDVANAAADAQALADRVAGGFNPPSGSAPQITKFRDALGAFAAPLRDIATSTSLLPQLSARLRLRSAKKSPADSAALLTAKQQVDATIADLAALNQTIESSRAKLQDQLAKPSIDGDALKAAIASGSESTTTAMAKVDDALDTSFAAILGAA